MGRILTKTSKKLLRYNKPNVLYPLRLAVFSRRLFLLPLPQLL